MKIEKKNHKMRPIDKVIESGVKLKDDFSEFYDEHFVAVTGTIGVLAIGGLIWTAKVLSAGIKLANMNTISMYYNGDIGTGDGIMFNHRIDIDEWIPYLEMVYSKTGKKKETRLAWLKEHGYID